ncbi:hypothetical protein RJT34_07411 [Clitoria ternatea]|uniref:Uncharacterized protein n=1 Tax=Clitoria ternatea TaxID=43366 RepID=A0AAN9K2L2_CLITE
MVYSKVATFIQKLHNRRSVLFLCSIWIDFIALKPVITCLIWVNKYSFLPVYIETVRLNHDLLDEGELVSFCRKAVEISME